MSSTSKVHPTLLAPSVARDLGEVLFTMGILFIALQVRKGSVRGLSRKSLLLFGITTLIQLFDTLSTRAHKGSLRLIRAFESASFDAMLRLHKDAPDAMELLVVIVRIAGVVGVLAALGRSEWEKEGSGGRDKGSVVAVVAVCLVGGWFVEYKSGLDVVREISQQHYKSLLPILTSSLPLLRAASLIPQLVHDEHGPPHRNAMTDFALCLLSAPSVAMVYGYIIGGGGLPEVLINKRTLASVSAALHVVIAAPLWVKLVQRRFIAFVLIGLGLLFAAVSLNFPRALAASHLFVLFLLPISSGFVGLNISVICLFVAFHKAGLVQLPPALQRFVFW